MLLKDNMNDDLSKDFTLRILTCELGLPVSKFVLKHFSVELSKMESKVSKDWFIESYLKFQQNFFFKIFNKRAE